jgi:hypothetical protein
MTMRVSLAGGAISLLLLSGSVAADAPRPPKLAGEVDPSESSAEARAKGSVVLISADHSGGASDSGAGIIVGTSGGSIYLVTADHVVRRGGKPAATVRVTFRWMTGSCAANLLPKHDLDADLAVLTVAASACPGNQRRSFPLPALREPRSLRPDEPVVLLGNPDGHPWQAYGKGETFSALVGDRVEFESSHLKHGHSGGALYDADLQLIGMVFVDTGTSGYAQTLGYIATRLRGWGYPFDLRPPHRLLSAGVALSCDAKGGRGTCWGDTTFEILGGGPAPSSAAGTIPIEGDPIKAVAAGFSHACALSRGGQVYCLGANSHGQLGNGTKTESVSIPSAVPTNLTFQSLTAGGWHTCALTSSGSAYCWGGGKEGRLGNDSGEDSATPVPVAGAIKFDAISAGQRNTCGLSRAGKAYCWGGINGTGATRYGADPPNAFVPKAVPGELVFTTLSAGSSTCGLTAAGQVYCWGLTDKGDDTPRRVATSVSFKSISASVENVCGVSVDGRIYCWGDNTFGQLGNGNKVSSEGPVPVSGGLKFESVSVGGRHACGVTVDDTVYCWGLLYGPTRRDGMRETSVPVKIFDP